MPTNFAHAPEALLGRSDSKNPASTCRGITNSGRPCRRAIALSKILQSSRQSSTVSGLDGVVAVFEQDGVDAADYYCWQHKDQASTNDLDVESLKLPPSRRQRETELYPLNERSSIDTLVQRLGIDSRSGRQQEVRRGPNWRSNVETTARTGTHNNAHRSDSRPTSIYSPDNTYSPLKTRRSQPKRRVGFWESLCCLADNEDDYVEIVRHRKRTETGRTGSKLGASVPVPVTKLQGLPLTLEPRGVSKTGSNRSQREYDPKPQRQPSYTNQLLSLIPQSLSPQATSALLGELAKPISPHDEDGYIYIFWLTPQSRLAPGDSTARSLLAPASERPHHARRVSDVMTEWSFDGSVTETKGKEVVMLKIGRANNVTRRMNEWQRQCGYELNLVRWYPYVPSSSAPSPLPSPERQSDLFTDLSRPSLQVRRQSDVVRKVPYVKRVERLIHLELAEKQVKRQCSTCGKEHREWFEVAATQLGVKAVDDCVKRWVNWAENTASSR